MRAREIYLDHAASAPLLPEARDAITRALALGPGNPSSAHASGRRLRAVLEEAREAVAALVDAPPSELVFTSGTSESNALALRGALLAVAVDRRVLVIGREAHATVRSLAAQLESEGIVVRRAGVDRRALLDPAEVARLAGEDATLVSLALVQSETGAVQPVRAVAEALSGTLLHVDAAQAAGRLPVNPHDLGADLLSLSSHKLGGPHGIGALVVRRGVALVNPAGSGAQERGRRSGTEAVALAAGFAAAARIAADRLPAFAAQATAVLAPLREFVAGRDDARLLSLADGVPSTCALAFDGCPGDALTAALDAEGFSVSTGTACASGARVPPDVLLAAGHGREVAAGAVRVSVGHDTRDEALTSLVATLRVVVPRVRSAFASG